MAISTPGIGSGLDVNSIVTQLVALERQPLQQLQAKASSIQTKISSYGRLKSELSALQDAVTNLQTSSSWGKKVFTSGNTALTGTASTAASAGNYAVQVTQLAQRQITNSGAYTVGSSGRLDIKLGEWTNANTFSSSAAAVSVTVLATDDLASIATKINAANAGVTASVVNSSNGPRLAMKSSATGATAGFEVKAFNAGGTQITDGVTGVGVLGYASATPGVSPPVGMTQAPNGAAQNAKVLVDGLEVSSATNTFSESVTGLSFTVNATTAASFQVGVTDDAAAAKATVEAFVAAFNKISTSLADLTKYDAATKKGAALMGDTAATGIQNTLKALSSKVGTGSTAYARLSDLGVEMQRDGTLKVNSTKLDAAIANTSQIKSFFTDTAGMAAALKTFTTNTLSSDGVITTRNKALQSANERVSKESTKVNTRAEQVQKRLLQQYSSLDTKMGTNQGIGNMVSQWISGLNKG